MCKNPSLKFWLNKGDEIRKSDKMGKRERERAVYQIFKLFGFHDVKISLIDFRTQNANAFRNTF